MAERKFEEVEINIVSEVCRGCGADLGSPHVPGCELAPRLTREQIISEPAGKTLNAWVAVAMGQRRVSDCPLGDPSCGGKYEPQIGPMPCLPNYSGGIATAWELVRAIRDWNFYPRMKFYLALQEQVSLRMLESGETVNVSWPYAILFLEPEHICRAFLLAALPTG